MNNKKQNNSIYVIWKSPKSRRNFLVARISKKEKYEFKYEEELEVAKTEGFKTFIPFPDEKRVYTNEVLFPIFSSRLPDKKRKDIDCILKKYQLKQYDEFELLKKGAELPTDNLKFVEAVDNLSELLQSEICLAGVRHYIGCKGKKCEDTLDLQNLELYLQVDPNNTEDKYAIKVMCNENTIGYIPRYYNKIVNRILSRGIDLSCTLVEFNRDKNCDGCIKMKLANRKEI